MLLVDTSVIIDYLKGKINHKTELFAAVLKRKLPFGIAIYTFLEVLQGAKNENEYKKLKSYLSTQKIYFLPEKTAAYEEAAFLYYTLRRQGITPRSTVDILIALIAIKNDLLLLHNDRDFDELALKLDDLNILERL
ncbi:MAG: PIN domain-containing protein [Clostridiales bacterium]|nr:PIN domain-containing protein [Clostridiales bacterium]